MSKLFATLGIVAITLTLSGCSAGNEADYKSDNVSLTVNPDVKVGCEDDMISLGFEVENTGSSVLDYSELSAKVKLAMYNVGGSSEDVSSVFSWDESVKRIQPGDKGIIQAFFYSEYDDDKHFSALKFWTDPGYGDLDEILSIDVNGNMCVM